MRTTLFLGGMLVLTLTSGAIAQTPVAQQQLQRIHSPRSIDDELAHLTQDLELTPAEQQQIRPLLVEHHDKIQALFDKNPTASREDLRAQIHAISDQTHHEINALLTPHQQQLAKAMQARERRDGRHS